VPIVCKKSHVLSKQRISNLSLIVIFMLHVANVYFTLKVNEKHLYCIRCLIDFCIAHCSHRSFSDVSIMHDVRTTNARLEILHQSVKNFWNIPFSYFPSGCATSAAGYVDTAFSISLTISQIIYRSLCTLPVTKRSSHLNYMQLYVRQRITSFLLN
jgi:hypothetical protein